MNPDRIVGNREIFATVRQPEDVLSVLVFIEMALHEISKFAIGSDRAGDVSNSRGSCFCLAANE